MRTMEVHIGNLTTEATQGVLTSAFNELFRALPDYCRLYNAEEPPVSRVQFLVGGESAFVAFLDEVLASTAILMDGFTLFGRPVSITRPRQYQIPEAGERLPLDVAPLRQIGMIPPVHHVKHLRKNQLHQRPVKDIDCQLYVGNMQECSRMDVVNLVSCICNSLPQLDHSKGPAVVDATFTAGGNACFVQLQSEALAGAAEAALQHAVLAERALAVRRPREYYDKKRDVERALAALNTTSCTFGMQDTGVSGGRH